nr:hypothetical protein [Dipteris conjugata]
MSLYLLQVSLLTRVKVAGPPIIFGLYYGLLTTLPVGPSQILSIRAFLLGGNLSGTVALSGLMMGQLLIFLSIFCSPLYALIVKPHVVTVPIVPYMLFYWFRTKDLPDYRTLRPTNSLSDFRIGNIFLDSFIFQILNPILLPSPVLARPIHLFIFRYSNNITFLISSFVGWSLGHMSFSYLSRLLLVRVEYDSPILYLLMKRVIYKTFSIVVLINVLVYLGKAPVPLFTKNFEDELVLLDNNLRELSDSMLWIFKSWPTSLFDPYKPNRPLRYIENSRFGGDSLVKKQVSNHFFSKCLTSGKQRLALTALPSLSIFGDQLGTSLEDSDMPLPAHHLHEDWILNQFRKNKDLNNELKDRIRFLDTEPIFWKAMERRTGLADNGGELPKIYDPFLNNSCRARIPNSDSFWILSDSLASQAVDNNEYANELNSGNKIRDWVSIRYKELRSNEIPLPREALPKNALQIFIFMFETPDDAVIEDVVGETNYSVSKGDSTPVTWDQVFKFSSSPTELALFFTYLRDDCGAFDWIRLLDVPLIGGERLDSSKQKIRSILEIEELSEELARNTHLIYDNRFDVAGGSTDIRNRKLKNLAISVGKTRLKTRRLVKRFAKSSDFRRKPIKGSMRSRRRKTLVWEVFQDKAHSPLFFRLMELPTPFRFPAGELTGVDLEESAGDARRETSTQPEQELISLSSSREGERAKSDRPAIAARFDVSSIHTGRGLLLVMQSTLRKYVKLPVLITLKNFGRILFFQAPEWDEDWSEWRKESHIKCTYDGEGFSHTRLPGRWLKEGLQIKILYPFRLKPWRTRGRRRPTILENDMNPRYLKTRESGRKNRLRRGKSPSSYLTAWGFQTDVPFGTIKKDPSFWKPIRKKLMRILRRSLALRTRQMRRLYSKLGVSARFPLGKLNFLRKIEGIWENWSGTDFVGGDIPNDTGTGWKEGPSHGEPGTGGIDETSIPIDNKSRYFAGTDDEPVKDTVGGSKSEPESDMHAFRNLLTEGVGGGGRSTKSLRFSKPGIDDRLINTNLTSSLRFQTKLVNIQGIYLRSRISVAELFEKYLLLVAGLFRRVNRAFAHYLDNFARFRVQLVKVTNQVGGVHGDANHPILAISGIREGIPRVIDNQSIGLPSQAHIHDILWHVSMKNNLDLDSLMEIAEDSKDAGYLDNRKGCKDNENLDDASEDWNYPRGDHGCYPKGGGETPEFFDGGKHDGGKSDSVGCPDDRTGGIVRGYGIDEHINNFATMRGLSKQLWELNANDLGSLLGCPDKYNLSLELWQKIAPKRWRSDIENLYGFRSIGGSFLAEHEYVFRDRQNDYSIYTETPFLRDRVRNINKRRKYSYLLHSFIDSSRDVDIQKFPAGWNAAIRETRLGNRIRELIAGKGISHPRILDPERELNPKSDLVLWVIPDPAEAKDVYETRSKFVPGTSILWERVPATPNEKFQRLGTDYGLQEEEIDSDEILLRERGSHYYIFQWKWESEALERELQRLRDLISLINVLENEQDLTSFCVNMGIDCDLLNLFLNEEKREILDDLFVISAHRLPRIFDDQILMYKMVSIPLKFRNRFKRRLNRNIFGGCMLRLSLINGERNRNRSYLHNIEDLLLPRHRRKSRFFRSLLISSSVKSERDPLGYPSGVEWMNKSEESSDLSGTQKIKRFLWPSYRLEELACMNRFRFDTNNGSRFATPRIRMYPII